MKKKVHSIESNLYNTMQLEIDDVIEHLYLDSIDMQGKNV